MTWDEDRLAPDEKLLFRSDLTKVGNFCCPPIHSAFARTEPLDNDVFVLVRNPLWFRRGGGDYRFVEPGGILLHRAGAAVERRAVTDVGDNSYWFGIRPDLFLEAMQRHRLPCDDMGGAMLADLSMRHCISMLVAQIDTGTADRLIVEEQILSLLSRICERRAGKVAADSRLRQSTVARSYLRVEAARAYVDAHLCENIGLDAIARAAGTSQYHLCRVFRQQTGMTMHAYRTQQRLGRAMDCLLAGDVANLGDLALELGFSSHSHLSRVFRRQMRQPPSALARSDIRVQAKQVRRIVLSLDL